MFKDQKYTHTHSHTHTRTHSLSLSLSLSHTHTVFKDQKNKKQYRRDEDRLFNQVLRRSWMPAPFLFFFGKKKEKRAVDLASHVLIQKNILVTARELCFDTLQ